jgi:hypothetical protein
MRACTWFIPDIMLTYISEMSYEKCILESPSSFVLFCTVVNILLGYDALMWYATLVCVCIYSFRADVHKLFPACSKALTP